MKKRKYKFESEIHLGLLVIIFSLLFLNFISNYTIYFARTKLRNQTTLQLNNAAITVTRTVQKNVALDLSEHQVDLFKKQFELSSMFLVSPRQLASIIKAPEDQNSNIVNEICPGQSPGTVRDIILSDSQSLTEGEHGYYFYTYPVPSFSGNWLLVLSSHQMVLDYLENANHKILIISIISTVLLICLYPLLLHYIIAPFRRIKKQAIDAGRPVSESRGDVEAVVEEYENIISDLQIKEEELLKFNEAIRLRADSLERFNEFLLNSMDSGIVTVTNDGKILSLNAAAEKILSVKESEWIAGDCHKIFKNSPHLLDILRNCTKTGESQPYREYEMLSYSDSKLVLGVSFSIIHDEYQKPIGISILINDLTELQKLRQELETRQKLAALGEMSGGLAHQLRNSLGTIVGYIRLIKKKVEKSEGENKSITALENETREAELLIERFMNFAKPLHPNSEMVYLSELVKDLIKMYDVRSGNTKIEFKISGSISRPIKIDQLLLKQALSNIIDNAINAYENRRGSVEIEMSEKDNDQIIEIKDYGCGISEENLNNIFTPFFSTRPSGNGLGLPLAGKIIDMHRGSISVNSKVGQGTKFTITLPIECENKIISEKSSIPDKICLG